MRRSLIIGLVSTLGLAMAFACSQKDDDDDNDSASTGPGLTPTDTNQGTGTGTSANTNNTDPVTSSDTGTATAEEPMCDSIPGLDAACLAQKTFSKANPVQMLIVLDKSGSMTSTGLGAGAKWEAMKTALAGALETAKANSNLSLGLELFPAQAVEATCSSTSVESCCEMSAGGAAINVEVKPAATSVDEIMAVINGTSPGGLTPTSVALDEAYNYFVGGGGSTLSGDKYILLATDGGPNCNGSLTCGPEECTLNLDAPRDDNGCATEAGRMWCVDHAETAAKIQALAGAGIRTIVVGIPGTENYATWLDAFAQAGGAPAPDDQHSYYEVSASAGVSGLQKTFEDITVNLVRECEIQMSQMPPLADMEYLSVAIDCVLVPPESASTGAAGAGSTAGTKNYEIDNSTVPPTVRLLGEYCEKVKKGVRAVDIVVGCPPIL